jgi:D-aminopeptidase
MKKNLKDILIIADIEGSSGCWSYAASSYMTEEWFRACVDMTRDVHAVTQALFDAGVQHITVKDFHRTGYNLLPEMIDSRVKIVSGYRQKPVPGIGDPGKARAVMFLGMHAASGTDGFLAHTLTSRIEKLLVNELPLAEIELFAASLAPYGIRPLFFSGCPIACRQALDTVPYICVYSIDKSLGSEGFDKPVWRSGLARAAVEALNNDSTRPHEPAGPFEAVVTMRDGQEAAAGAARRWGLRHANQRIFIRTDDIHQLYLNLIRLCYLTPVIECLMPFSLFLYNLWGRIGRLRLRHWLKKYSNDF